jgi:hypothetical protein
MSNTVSALRRNGLTALAAILMTVSCVSVTSAQQGGQPKQGAKAGRTERVVIDGKEVRSGDGSSNSDLSTQTAPRSGRDTDVKWSDDHGHGSVSAKNVELTDDLNDVKFIPAGGYLTVDESRGGLTRRFRAEPGKDGKIKRAYLVNGEAHEFDADGKKWLARILHKFFGD